MNDIYSRTHASHLEDTYFHEETLRRIEELRSMIAQRSPQIAEQAARPAPRPIVAIAA